MIAWPGGWQIQPQPSMSKPGGGDARRERAVKNDAGGNPLMVVELTRTTLQPGHQVNLQAVLLEMRRAVQFNFSHGGYQSRCTPIHDSLLGDLPAVETTCEIQLDGGHVLTQTLVAAAQQSTAYSLSYAGSADGYEATEDEVMGIRRELKLLR